jgi:hypothetical protein
MTNDDSTRIRAWLRGRLPTDWFLEPAEVTLDRDEILIVGRIDEPPTEPVSDDADTDNAARSTAQQGRIRHFREDTRARRIQIARELEHHTGRRVSWGVRCGDTTELFTTASIPVMTRLRQPERRVLDTLVDAGVARSRSDALAWCVRLTGQHNEQWLTDLREALTHVEDVRRTGPRPPDTP